MFDRISTRGLAILLFAVAPSTGFAQQVDGTGGARVEVQITGADNKAAFKGADPITISFTMKNPSSENIQVLAWRTPFKEGVTEDIFAVAGGAGGQVQYIGPIVKRRPPGPEDYITIGPGQSLTATVDLANYYTIYSQGDYAVTYKGTHPSPAPIAASATAAGPLKKIAAASNAYIFSVTEARAPAPKAAAAVVLAPGTLSFDQCDNGQQNDAKAAVPEALKIAAAARDFLKTPPAPGSQRYKTWFGAQSDLRFGKITDHYEKIEASFRTQAIQIACNNSGCRPGYYAFVFPNQPYKIYVCEAFWAAGLSGTDSRSGTLVHEMSYFQIVATTNDVVYGQSGARQLATQDPDSAITNADSHEYFAENDPNLPLRGSCFCYFDLGVGVTSRGSTLTTTGHRPISTFPADRPILRPLIAVLVMAGWAFGNASAMAQDSNNNIRVEYRLEAAGPATAKSAKVKFTLTNRGQFAVDIDIAPTPLIGAIETDMFAIHCNNNDTPLNYQGIMKSEFSAGVVLVKGKGDDFLKVLEFKPGESRDAVVDLATVYTLPELGSCKVAFTHTMKVVELTPCLLEKAHLLPCDR